MSSYDFLLVLVFVTLTLHEVHSAFLPSNMFCLMCRIYSTSLKIRAVHRLCAENSKNAVVIVYLIVYGIILFL